MRQPIETFLDNVTQLSCWPPPSANPISTLSSCSANHTCFPESFASTSLQRISSIEVKPTESAPTQSSYTLPSIALNLSNESAESHCLPLTITRFARWRIADDAYWIYPEDSIDIVAHPNNGTLHSSNTTSISQMCWKLPRISNSTCISNNTLARINWVSAMNDWSDIDITLEYFMTNDSCKCIVQRQFQVAKGPALQQVTISPRVGRAFETVFTASIGNSTSNPDDVKFAFAVCYVESSAEETCASLEDEIMLARFDRQSTVASFQLPPGTFILIVYAKNQSTGFLTRVVMSKLSIFVNESNDKDNSNVPVIDDPQFFSLVRNSGRHQTHENCQMLMNSNEMIDLATTLSNNQFDLITIEWTISVLKKIDDRAKRLACDIQSLDEWHMLIQTASEAFARRSRETNERTRTKLSRIDAIDTISHMYLSSVVEGDSTSNRCQSLLNMSNTFDQLALERTVVSANEHQSIERKPWASVDGISVWTHDLITPYSALLNNWYDFALNTHLNDDWQTFAFESSSSFDDASISTIQLRTNLTQPSVTVRIDYDRRMFESCFNQSSTRSDIESNQITSITIVPVEDNTLSFNTSLRMKMPLHNVSILNASCAWWDHTRREWSHDGCRTLATNECECDHLTEFAMISNIVKNDSHMYLKNQESKHYLCSQLQNIEKIKECFDNPFQAIELCMHVVVCVASTSVSIWVIYKQRKDDGWARIMSIVCAFLILATSVLKSWLLFGCSAALLLLIAVFQCGASFGRDTLVSSPISSSLVVCMAEIAFVFSGTFESLVIFKSFGPLISSTTSAFFVLSMLRRDQQTKAQSSQTTESNSSQIFAASKQSKVRRLYGLRLFVHMIAVLSGINGIANAAWVNVIALDSILIIHSAVFLIVFEREHTKRSSVCQAADHSVDPAQHVQGASNTSDEGGFLSADQVFSNANAGLSYSIHPRSTQFDAESATVYPPAYNGPSWL